MKTVSPVTSIFFFFNGCNSLIYNLKKVQVFSEKTYGKLWKNIRKKVKSFPIVFPKTMGKLFKGFGSYFCCQKDTSVRHCGLDPQSPHLAVTVVIEKRTNKRNILFGTKKQHYVSSF